MSQYPDYLMEARKAFDRAVKAVDLAVGAINAGGNDANQIAIAKIDWDLADDAKTEAYRVYTEAKKRYLSERGQ